MGEELWYVKLANGDVHRVTIDQLDGAFQAGHIDESTMVLAAGASQWTKLGDMAGLDEGVRCALRSRPPVPVEDDDFARPQATRRRAARLRPPVHADERAGLRPPGPGGRAARLRPAGAVARSHRPHTCRRLQAAPVPSTPAGLHPAGRGRRASRRRSLMPRRPTGRRTRVAVSMKPAPVVAPYVPNSLRPMSMDLGDLDLDMPVQRKGRAGRFAVAVVALAAIAGGVGFAARSAPTSAWPPAAAAAICRMSQRLQPLPPARRSQIRS